MLQRPSGEQPDIPGSTRDGESTQTRNNSDYSTTETGSYSDCDGNWYVAIVTSSGLGSVFCVPQVPFAFELGVWTAEWQFGDKTVTELPFVRFGEVGWMAKW